MSNSAVKALASLALCAALTGTAFARSGDHDRDRPRSHHDTVRDRDRDHDRARDRDRDRDRREARERRERREAREREWRREHRQNTFFGDDGRPHGWTQGRKTGWRNCNLPPGQAKKAGCISTWHRKHRRPVARRDRDHDGDRD